MSGPVDDGMLVEAWARAGLSRKSIAVYLVAVRRARRDLDLESVGAIELSAWAQRTFGSRAALALERSALRAYWLATGRPDAPDRAIRVPRRRRMRCRALTEAPAAALAAAARTRALAGTRKGLAVLLGLYSGLRRSEIAGLRWSEIGDDGWMRVAGKGSEREIPVHPVVQEALAVARRRSPPGSPRGRRGADRLFAGRFGDAVNPTTVWTWVRELAGDAGLAPFGAHVLRHTALATALDATGDLRAVQELAGHARPETTAGYTRTTRRRLEAAARAVEYAELRA